MDYHSRVVSLGSCFAVNISEKFDYFKFDNTVNPFGILFHPLALEKFIGFAVNKKQFAESDIFFHNERWHCFDAHSDLSHQDKNRLLDNLNNSIALANSQIQNATHVIITLGTAWIYRDIASQEIVANCHKVPQKEFEKELLPVETIRESLGQIIAFLQKANPEIHIIFTVSPVRHLKDGFVENQWSKANLISALQQTIQNMPQASYFPSYEIMMDELRDYRFYDQDMLHPGATAIDYIWERFAGAWIAESAFPVMEEVAAVQKALSHKPFHPGSERHTSFLQSLERKKVSLQSRFPSIRFE